jgi:hypothetical protein
MMKTAKRFSEHYMKNYDILGGEGRDPERPWEDLEGLKVMYTYSGYGIYPADWSLYEEDRKNGYLKQPWRDPDKYVPTVKGIREMQKYMRNPEGYEKQIAEKEEEEKEAERKKNELTVYKYRANDLVQMGKFIERVLGMGYKSLGTDGHLGNSHVILRKENTQVEIYLPLSEVKAQPTA